MKRLIKLIPAGAVTFLAGAAFYMPFVIKDAKTERRDKCDYLLILGGNIIGAETPSKQLSERMRAAADYLNENKNVIAVPCGGCFRKEQKKSEAEIISAYLQQNGIDGSRIIPEDKSATTFENFRFGREIIKKHSGKSTDETSIAFLSSNYHVHRAQIIAKRCGIKNIGCVSCKMHGNALKPFAREYITAFELLYHFK